MKFVFNDGGRSNYFKGVAYDCVCRSISVALNLDYLVAYIKINQLGKATDTKSSARNGVYKPTLLEVRKWLQSQGWTWVPTMGIGTGCKVHLRESELPKGNIIVRLSGHYAAVIDGVLHDNHDCSRDGTRCVYGYFIKQ